MDDLAKAFTEHMETMRRRTDAALEACGFDHLLIPSGHLRYGFLDDNPYPFKVNPHFKRWVPVTDNPECLLVYTPGAKPKLAFYSPVDFWHKTHPVPDDFWTAHFDIHAVGGIEDAVSLLPAKLERAALIGEMRPVFADWGLGGTHPEDLINRLHYDFAWKTAYEIECMREANRLGARAHRAAEKAFRDGASEYEIHLAYLAAAEHTEDELPYTNIVALNEHAAILHYNQPARRAPADRRSFLIDAGCTFHGYASDITRTYAAENNDFQAMIDRLDQSQRALCDAIQPGMDYTELQLLTHRHVAEILNEFDVAKGDPDALVAEGVTRAFFPHGIGHYIGAQVHDVGGKMADANGTAIPQPKDQPFLRLTRRIEAGQAFTIEPGLYFIPSLLDELKKRNAGQAVNWQRVEELQPFGGIRIEDDVCVTENGHENLTRPAFAELA